MKFLENEIREIELSEKFNFENARRLLLSDLITIEGKRKLKKYLSNFMGNTLQVVYTSKDYGRLTAKIKDSKPGYTCMTQCCMWNEIKAVGCRGIYTDIDIVNCHPVLLQQLYQSEGYSTEYLKRYIDDRCQLCQDMHVTKDNIKKLVYGLIYKPKNFNSSKWQFNCKVEHLPELFGNLEAEMKVNAVKILDKYPMFMTLAKTRQQPDYWNLEGSALSYLAQQLEKTCLFAMFDFLTTNGYCVGSLIHDGLHVEGIVSSDMLKKCAKAVFEETGFGIKIVPKEFQDYEDRLNVIKMVETDCDAADIILESMLVSDHELVVSQGRMYFRQDNMYIVDASKKHEDIQAPLMNYINTFHIFKEGAKEPVSITRNIAPARQVREAVFNHARQDADFTQKIHEWSKGKLCYKNGYYDFKQGEFLSYDDDTMTTIRISLDYDDDVPEADIKELYERVLIPIFTDDEEMLTFFLRVMARVMAGHVEDKQWIVMIGERNCGKGVLTTLFQSCFKEYVRTTDANNFIAKRGSSDSALDKKWLVPLDMARAVFTNEIDMTDDEKKVFINGALMKELASGGDEMTARGLFQSEVKFYLQCQFVLMLNDMPEAKPKDCLTNCKEFHMGSQFVEGEPQENCIVKEYKKDDSIRNVYVKSERAIKAFTKVLFEHYSSTKPEEPQQIKDASKDNLEESDLAQFKELYDFTNCDKDFLTVQQFNYILEESSLTTTTRKAKLWLTKMGVVQKQKKLGPEKRNTKCYFGMKQISDYNEFNDYENVVNDLDEIN